MPLLAVGGCLCSARFKDELLPHLENKRVDVMWMDDQIAGLWANSEFAKAEFPDYSFLVSMSEC